MDGLPPRWRPFARRREIRKQEIARGVDFQNMLWELSQREGPIPLGVITKDGYQGGMHPDVARFLHGD